MTRSYQRGFTLIEIMVVVVILGILATLIVPRIADKPDEARIIKAQQDIRAIETALADYRFDNHRYPTTEQGLEALVERPTSPPVPKDWKEGGYLKRVPKDPWGTPYKYLNPGTHGDIDVYTLGADGQRGGEGADADIGNWSVDG